jgi:hypothetical protein
LNSQFLVKSFYLFRSDEEIMLGAIISYLLALILSS